MNIISKIFTKLFIFPLVFFFGYGLTLVGAENLMNLLGYEVNSLKKLIISIVMSSSISFIITIAWYGIVVRLFKSTKQSFIRRYHYTHLVLFYISGLFTALLTIEPILIEENLIQENFNENLKFSMLILFLTVTNYTIFNSIILNDDFKLTKKSNSSKQTNL